MKWKKTAAVIFYVLLVFHSWIAFFTNLELSKELGLVASPLPLFFLSDSSCFGVFAFFKELL